MAGFCTSDARFWKEPAVSRLEQLMYSHFNLDRSAPADLYSHSAVQEVCSPRWRVAFILTTANSVFLRVCASVSLRDSADGGYGELIYLKTLVPD